VSKVITSEQSTMANGTWTNWPVHSKPPSSSALVRGRVGVRGRVRIRVRVRVGVRVRVRIRGRGRGRGRGEG
jgi:hypothetical protein